MTTIFAAWYDPEDSNGYPVTVHSFRSRSGFDAWMLNVLSICEDRGEEGVHVIREGETEHSIRNDEGIEIGLVLTITHQCEAHA